MAKTEKPVHLAAKFKNHLVKHIKGRHSYIICILITSVFFLIGFSVPHSLEFVTIEKDAIKDLLSGILSTFVGVLGVSFAISAIILSILQLANRKLSILELVFTNSLFAPVFYFGLINISILSYLTLFTSQKTLFGSSFVFTRIVVIELYALVLFLILIILVFVRVFKYLDFTYLTTDYVKDTLSLLRLEKNTSIPQRLSQKISQRGKEINQEINEALQKEDDVLISILLNCLSDAMMFNSSSNLVTGITIYLEKWIIVSNAKKIYPSRYLLLTFWREIMVFLSQNENNVARSTFIGFGSRVYLADHAQNPSSNLADSFTIRLKEMSQYQLLLPDNNRDQNLPIALKAIDFYLADFNLLIKSIAVANNIPTLRYALNELRQLLSLYKNGKAGGPIIDEGATGFSDIDPIFTDDPPISDLKLKIQGIPFGIYSWLYYKKLYTDQDSVIDHETQSALANAFLTDSPYRAFEIVIFFFTHPSKNYHWEDWIWSLEERLSGVVYSLPSPEDVLSFGILSLMLEKRFYDPTKVSQKLLANIQFRFLVERCKTFLHTIVQHPDRWFAQFRFANVDEFLENCKMIETWLTQINDKREQLENENLTKLPLDAEKVRQFTTNMQRQWKESEHIGKVFDHFQAIEVNPPRELKRIGMNINAENLKFAFVRSDSETPYLGLDFGKEIARNKEQLFGRFLQEQNLPISSEVNLVTGIMNAISDLKKNKYSASVIFSTYRTMLREEVNLSNSGNYTPTWKQTTTSFPFFYQGVFENNVPLIRIHSDFSRDLIIVADLKKAFKLLERENDKWFEKRLQIEVIQIDKNHADQIYSRKGLAPDSPDKENAMNKIMSGVIIDIDEICDFELLDKNAIRVFKLK